MPVLPLCPARVLTSCGLARWLAQHQLLKTGLKLSNVDFIFITHLHGDHVFGLPGLLCTLGMQRTIPTNPDEEPNPVHVVGPPGTASYVHSSLALSFSHLCYRVIVHGAKRRAQQQRWHCWHRWPFVTDTGRVIACAYETELVESAGPISGGKSGGVSLPVVPNDAGLWEIAKTKQLSIVAAPLEHTVPAVGFVITEALRPGKLQMKFIKPALDRNR